MSKQDSPKNGLVLQLNWPLSIYTKDFVNLVAENGISLDFVTTGRSVTPYLNFSQINANIFVLLNKISSAYQFFWKFWRVLSILLPWICPVDPLLRRSVLTHIKRRDYNFVIAIEKESLLIAAQLFRGTDTKIYYWSLELYNEGHPSYFKYRNLNVHARFKYKFISGCFIQDQLRWSVIKRECDIGIKPCYLPLCVRGPSVSIDKVAVRIKYGIDKNAIVLMAHGNISNNRGLNDMIELADLLGDGMTIVVHGKLLQSAPVNLPRNILIINDVFPEEDLVKFIAAADIGLALYCGVSENEQFIAFSSHKIAIYARCGLPYIAYHNESFEALHDVVMWGVTVNTVNEMVQAVDAIISKYEFYRQQTHLAYEKIYMLDAHKDEIIAYLS